MRKPQLLIITSVLILTLAALHIYTGWEEDNVSVAAVPYLRTALTDISDWQPETLHRYLSDEAAAAITDKQLNALVERFSTYGRLQSISDLKFNRLARAMSLFGQRRITYSGIATYTNGKAEFTMTLIATDGGGLAIYNLNLSPKNA